MVPGDPNVSVYSRETSFNADQSVFVAAEHAITTVFGKFKSFLSFNWTGGAIKTGKRDARRAMSSAKYGD